MFDGENNQNEDLEINDIADLYHNQEQLYTRVIGIELIPKKNSYEISQLAL